MMQDRHRSQHSLCRISKHSLLPKHACSARPGLVALVANAANRWAPLDTIWIFLPDSVLHLTTIALHAVVLTSSPRYKAWLGSIQATVVWGVCSMPIGHDTRL